MTRTLVGTRDPDYLPGDLRRGAWAAIDIWGDEDAYGGNPMPRDTERLDAVLQLIELGWATDPCTARTCAPSLS